MSQMHHFNHHYRNTLCRAMGLANVIAFDPDPELIRMLIAQLAELDEKTRWLAAYVDSLSPENPSDLAA